MRMRAFAALAWLGCTAPEPVPPITLTDVDDTAGVDTDADPDTDNSDTSSAAAPDTDTAAPDTDTAAPDADTAAPDTAAPDTDTGPQDSAPPPVDTSIVVPLPCTDAFEPNDMLLQPAAITAGSWAGLHLCPTDQDHYSIVVGGGQTLNAALLFDHNDSNLDLELRNSAGTLLLSSTSTTDDEEVEYDNVLFVQTTLTVRVYRSGSDTAAPGAPYTLNLALTP